MRIAIAVAVAVIQGATAFAQDATPPKVVAMTPAAGSRVTVAPDLVLVSFDEAIDAGSVDGNTVRLVRSGGDGTFADGNEVTIVPAGISLVSPATLSINLTGVVLPPDRYRLTIAGYNAGSALAFDGADDFANAPQWLSGTGTTFTMECWARALGSGGSDGNTIIHRADFNDNYLAWAVATGTHECSVTLNEKATSLTETFNFGTWYHVAGTYDGATVRLYINGNLVGTHTVAQTINWDAGYFGSYIGGNGRDPYNKFNGELDEVRIWNVTRSQAEIQACMKRRLTGTESGLMGYYRFDEGTGQDLQDLSPAARHATRGPTSGAEGDDPTWIVSTAPVSGVSDLAGNALDGGDFTATFDLAGDDISVGGGCGFIGLEEFLPIAAVLLLARRRRRPPTS